MEEVRSDDLIPEHKEGAQSNTEAIAVFSDETAAKTYFEKVKQRLFNINEWRDLAGPGTSHFQLTDHEGNPVRRPAQKGDHFMIDIPGPGPATGDGYDWVHIEAIDEVCSEAEESVVIRVRPTTNPKNDRKDVAHFFTEESTSSFMVKREGNTIKACVYGRNERPNTKAEKTADKIRNAAVATGAVSGFSKLQWKSLVKGLVKQE